MVKPIYISEELHKVIKLSVIDLIPNYSTMSEFVEKTIYEELSMIAESTKNKILKQRLEEYESCQK